MTDRDEDQRLAIHQWKLYGLNGTIDGAVGYGKTVMTDNWVIKPCLEKFPDIKIVIIVPSVDLLNNWKAKSDKIQVYTVASVMNKHVEADLIIYDEIHLYLNGAKWKKVLDFKAKWKLALSGTLTTTSKAKLAMKKLPVVYSITLEESIAKGWNNNYLEYNYEIMLSKKESEFIKIQEQKYQSIIGYLGEGEFDYNILRKVLYKRLRGLKKVNGQIVTWKSGKRKGLPVEQYEYPYAEELANKLGTEVQRIVMMAHRANLIIANRKTFFYNHPAKIQHVKSILDYLNHRKIIVFTMQTEFADRLASECGTVSYHSGYKKKERVKMMQDFVACESGSFISCLAVNVGVDIKGLDTAINVAYYSTEESNKQRLGRAVRLVEKYDENGKRIPAIIINMVMVYHPAVTGSTIEEKWLRKFQKGRKATVIKSYDEISEN